MKILLAEDSLIDQKLFKRLLANYDFVELIICNDGLEAFEKFQSTGDIDLIVTDINMPRMSGFELIEKLNKEIEAPLPPIVIISSSEHEEDTQRAEGFSVAAYINKPFKRESFQQQFLPFLKSA